MLARLSIVFCSRLAASIASQASIDNIHLDAHNNSQDHENGLVVWRITEAECTHPEPSDTVSDN